MEIWAIEDKNQFVVELSEIVMKKCDYGENLSVLTGPEKIFYITQVLEMEVNNGGFSQFFYNSSGDLSQELVSAFLQIGAEKTANICKKALDAFGKELPKETSAREDFLDAMDWNIINPILEECDNLFYEYEDDLNTLNYEYAMKNKASFT